MEFTEKYHQMDATQRLVPNGHCIRSGMVVLIEDPKYRVDNPLNIRSVVAYDLAMRWNRWCKVTVPEIEDDILRFVANYEDGSQKKIRVSVQEAWYVKLDSVIGTYRGPLEQAQRLYFDILELADVKLRAQLLDVFSDVHRSPY